jgi:7,8-dihydropterin-6-yl-methyl-4-(beta-D-ribofuranosyl)aminobenzene 5'-phosphate synthase
MIQITCLVEDQAQPGTDLRAEHGVSFHIQTPTGQMLFDTGESGDVLQHNAACLGIDLAQIDAIAISHAHRDHTGGLPWVLEHTQPRIPLYASPDLFRERYVGQDRHAYGLPMTREELAERVTLRLSAKPVPVIPDVWTTGEITDRPDFEGRGETHVVRVNGGWQPDPYRDDFSLVLKTFDGLVVLLGCGHAGLLNILNHVTRHFEGPIVAIAGGTHLISATGDLIQQVIDALGHRYQTARLFPNHCTGEKAITALTTAFGTRVQPCPAGTVLRF